MKKICLDAGHYSNYNQSPVLKSYYEGNMTWKLCKYLKEYLENNYEVEIITTRTSSGKDLGLYDRGMKAKGCDGFYSLHSNYCEDPKVDRVVIIRALGVTSLDTYAKELGDAIKKVMGVSNKTQVWERANKGNEYYGVLRGAKAAGVKNRYIIEHSFHSNLKATKFLNEDANLKKLAQAEGKVIAKHHNLKSKATAAPESPQTPSNGITTNYLVTVDTDSLNVRKGPSTEYEIVGKVKRGEVYTIVETKGDWGKLKSGLGWINLKYTKKK